MKIMFGSTKFSDANSLSSNSRHTSINIFSILIIPTITATYTYSMDGILKKPRTNPE